MFSARYKIYFYVSLKKRQPSTCKALCNKITFCSLQFLLRTCEDQRRYMNAVSEMQVNDMKITEEEWRPGPTSWTNQRSCRSDHDSNTYEVKVLQERDIHTHILSQKARQANDKMQLNNGKRSGQNMEYSIKSHLISSSSWFLYKQ
jgi:hypothetical protein